MPSLENWGWGLTKKCSVPHQIQVGDRKDGPKLLPLPAIHDPLQDEGDALRNILIEELDELVSVCLAGEVADPPLPVGSVAEVLGVHVDHATP